MAPSTRFFLLTLCMGCTVPLVVAQDTTDVPSIEALKFDNNCATDVETEYKAKHYRKLMLRDAGECCDACQKDPKCNAWTYMWDYGYVNQKTCWLLKDATVVDEVRDHRKMSSGIRETRKTPFANISFEDGIDYKEKNLYTVKKKTVQACADFCAKQLLCKTFTYNKKTNSCYGKRGTWGRQKDERMISGVVW